MAKSNIWITLWLAQQTNTSVMISMGLCFSSAECDHLSISINEIHLKANDQLIFINALTSVKTQNIVHLKFVLTQRSLRANRFEKKVKTSQ